MPWHANATSWAFGVCKSRRSSWSVSGEPRPPRARDGCAGGGGRGRVSSGAGLGVGLDETAMEGPVEMKQYSWTIPTIAAVGFYLGGMEGIAYSLGGLSVIRLIFALVAGKASKENQA